MAGRYATAALAAAGAAGYLCALSRTADPEPEPEPEPQPQRQAAPHPPAADASLHLSAAERELAAAITIMVNTSPIEIHPSTVIIEEIVGALIGHVPLLCGCQKLIVCDWFKVKEANKYRSGQITAEKARRYEEYVARLRRLSAKGSGNALEGATVLVLTERSGFGFAVKQALPQVSTPYILMQQHDRRLRQPFDVLGVLRAMVASNDTDPAETGGRSGSGSADAAAGPMNYVGLCTTTTLGHAEKMNLKFKLDVLPHSRSYPSAAAASPAGPNRAETASGGSPAAVEELRFVPLLQWYDSTHICSTGATFQLLFGDDFDLPCHVSVDSF